MNIYTNRNRLIDTENKIMVTKGKGRGERQIRSMELTDTSYST